jgi:hypothetical protein
MFFNSDFAQGHLNDKTATMIFSGGDKAGTTEVPRKKNSVCVDSIGNQLPPLM